MPPEPEPELVLEGPVMAPRPVTVRRPAKIVAARSPRPSIAKPAAPRPVVRKPAPVPKKQEPEDLYDSR